MEYHTLKAETLTVHQIRNSKLTSTSQLPTPLPMSRKLCHRCGKSNDRAENCFYKEAICNVCKKKDM